MGSLSTIDNDALELVISKLKGSHILQLIICGSRSLTAKVLASTTDLILSFAGLGSANCPAILSSFHRLGSLRLASRSDTPCLPILGVKIDKLPRSLKKLELRYFDPVFDIWKPFLSPSGTLEYTPFDFSLHLPILETIELYTSQAIPVSLLANFPSTLVELNLNCEEIFDGIPMMRYMPQGLRKLGLGQVKDCLDKDAWKFPPDLTSFDVWMEANAVIFFPFLPKSLTELSVLVSTNETPMWPHWKHLPRNLLHFSVFGGSEAPPIEAFADLPALESIYCSWYHDSAELSEEAQKTVWRSLPSSLRKVEIGELPVAPEWLPWFPIKCEKLTLSHSSLLEPMPSRLKGLTLTSGCLLPSAVEMLPTTLRELVVTSITDEAAFKLSHLPLTRLAIKSGRLFASSGVASLPRTLTSFSVGHDVFDSVSCFDYLPPLTYFSLTSHGSRSSPYDPLNPKSLYAFYHPEASSRLPNSMTRLSLFSGHTPIEWFKGLKSSKIAYLTITSLISFPAMELVQCLPPCLTYLSAALKDLNTQATAALPRGLSYLSCPNGITLSPELIQQLPPYLYQLDVSHTKALSDPSSILPLLPPFLFQFRIDWDTPSWFHPSFDPYAKWRRLISPSDSNGPISED